MSLKQKIRRESERKRRLRLALIVTVLVSISLGSGFIIYSILNRSPTSQAVGFKAAIVDQLSRTFPNSSFNDNARTVLVPAGYTVDYYAPDQVTVEFFRSLPSKGYDLVIIRAHSTGWFTGDPITIYTSEIRRPDIYVYEQLTGSLTGGNLKPVDNRTYFTIPAKFVRDAMQGKFSNSMIIMMGCTGLRDSEMAQAFIDRGANVYISWDKSVDPHRTDMATAALLRQLVQGRTVRQAVNISMSLIGPDVFNSQLAYYPVNGGDTELHQNSAQGPVMSDRTTFETYVCSSILLRIIKIGQTRWR
jgi:hypothetical protein